MILMKDDLRVALVTGHIPVREIASAITKELIQEKLLVFNRALKQDFGIGAPRIAVLSLNPHAGDEGLLGTEEQEVIILPLKNWRGKAYCVMVLIRLMALWVPVTLLILTVYWQCITIRDLLLLNLWLWMKV